MRPPQLLSSQPLSLLLLLSLLLGIDSQTLIAYNGPVAVMDGDSFTLAVGDTLSITLEETAPSVQQLYIVPMETNGLPPVSELSIDGPRAGGCSDNRCLRTFTLMAREEHAGLTYNPCFQQMRDSGALPSPAQLCFSIAVVPWSASIVGSVPSMDVYLGTKIEFDVMVQVTAGACPTSANYTGSSIISSNGMSVGTDCFGPGPTPMLEGVAESTYPSSANGLLEGSTLMLSAVDASARPQVATYQFVWEPKQMSSSSVPHTLCLRPFFMYSSGTKVMGSMVCAMFTVPKCRHKFGMGETMETVANLYGTHWLQLFHANPSLPSGNPDRVAPGYEARLGVLYTVRQGDDLARVAQRFLLEPEDLLGLNPELAADASLMFDPPALDVVAQIDVMFTPGRRVEMGENITIRVDGLEGPAWMGKGIPECPAPASSMNVYQSSCDPSTHSPGDSCGAGTWGECQYDNAGVMYCRQYSCSDAGMHPYIKWVTWEPMSEMLTFTVKDTIPAGTMVKVVVPKSGGLMLTNHPQPDAHQPSEMRRLVNPMMATAMVPLAQTVWTPMGTHPNHLCVALPLCEEGLNCLFGTDCSFNAQ